MTMTLDFDPRAVSNIIDGLEALYASKIEVRFLEYSEAPYLAPKYRLFFRQYLWQLERQIYAACDYFDSRNAHLAKRNW